MILVGSSRSLMSGPLVYSGYFSPELLPVSSLRPSGNSILREFARNAPSFDWNPLTMILVPSGSECLFQPFLSRTPGAPPSTAQCWTWPSFSTSRYSQVCGLVHSIFTTLPSSRTGLVESNSAEKEWWADAVAISRAAVPKSVISLRFIECLLPYWFSDPERSSVADPGASDRYKEVYPRTARTCVRAVARCHRSAGTAASQSSTASRTSSDPQAWLGNGCGSRPEG